MVRPKISGTLGTSYTKTNKAARRNQLLRQYSAGPAQQVRFPTCRKRSASKEPRNFPRFFFVKKLLNGARLY